MGIIVDSSYEPKYTLNQFIMVFLDYHSTKKSFAFLLVLKRCPYKPAFVQAKCFFWSTHSAIDCV